MERTLQGDGGMSPASPCVRRAPSATGSREARERLRLGSGAPRAESALAFFVALTFALAWLYAGAGTG